MAIPRGEQLHWWRLGFSAGVASMRKAPQSEVARWLQMNAEYRDQVKADRLADVMADLDEVIDVLARALMEPRQRARGQGTQPRRPG